MTVGALETLRRRERTIAHVRWAVAFVAAVQAAAGLAAPAPPAPAVLTAVAVVALLVLTGVAVTAADGRLQTVGARQRLAGTVMAADVLAAAVHVWAGSAGGGGIAWGALVLLSLEGALRRRFAGAVLTSAGAAAGYVVLEVAVGTNPAAEVAGGGVMLLLIGAFGGAIAREFDVERKLFQRMAAASQDIAGRRDAEAILGALAGHVCLALDAPSATVHDHVEGRWVVRTTRAGDRDDTAGDVAAPTTVDARWSVTWRPAPQGRGAVLTLPVRLPDRPAVHVLAVRVLGPRPRGLTEGALMSLAEATAVTLAKLELISQEQASNGRLQHLEALRTRFVATVAHDLRSPLTTVKGVASILRDRRDAVAPERVDAMLASVERQADRLNRLAEDLLDAARLDTDKLQLAMGAVDLAAILRDVAADGDGALQVHAEVPLRVHGDAARIERVVWNLVSNAQKYGRPPVVVTALADAVTGDLHLEVRDHGPGLDAAQQHTMFADFAAGEDPGSVGLGLAIVWQLVAAHGGTVTYADARPGARFTVILPAGALSAETLPAGARPVTEVSP